MAKKETKPKNAPDAAQETELEQAAAPEASPESTPEKNETPDPCAALQAQLDQAHESHLRLAAEYDNFRKRTQKEKDQSFQNGRADAVGKMLPVYDDLERAMKQDTADEAYKKGVEMTMAGLCKVLSSLGVEAFGEVGDAFDPKLHNAVMHVQDESLGENVLAQVFQKGFRMGEQVIRFAMVQVAN